MSEEKDSNDSGCGFLCVMVLCFVLMNSKMLMLLVMLL